MPAIASTGAMPPIDFEVLGTRNKFLAPVTVPQAPSNAFIGLLRLPRYTRDLGMTPEWPAIRKLMTPSPSYAMRVRTGLEQSVEESTCRGEYLDYRQYLV
jgi:hypothetical protein